MHEVGGLASVAAVCRDRYEGKAPVAERHLHRQGAGHPGSFALPDAIPALGHTIRLGKGGSFVQRPVANLPLAKQAVFLRVAVGLFGGVWRLVKDPHLALSIALQAYEGVA